MRKLNLQRFRDIQQRRGALIPLFALMLVVLFGMAAFVADIGNIIVVKTTLGAAADAAALAGAGAMVQDHSLDVAQVAAIGFGNNNVPDGYGNVIDASSISFGVWDPETRTFTATTTDPNAIRVTVQRSEDRDNPVPYFFGRVFGLQGTEVSASAVAVGAVSTPDAAYSPEVYVTSSKDLSNVVLKFADGTNQKFDDLSGYTGTFQGTGEHEGKEIVGVWIKSGCNHSNDGPGYGEYVTIIEDGETAHGENTAHGCTPHVTATFRATGVQFMESGSISPVRLVQ